MGGVWGVGAALVFETLPTEGRGTFSGILQEGYAFGSILASAAFGLLFAGFHWHGLTAPAIGWRGLFILGSSPALLAFYVQARVAESPCGWPQRKSAGRVPPPMGRRACSSCFTFCLRFCFWCCS